MYFMSDNMHTLNREGIITNYFITLHPQFWLNKVVEINFFSVFLFSIVRDLGI